MAKRKFRINTGLATDLQEVKEISELEGRKNALWGREIPYDEPAETGPLACHFDFKIKKGARIFQVKDSEGLTWVLQNGMPLEGYDALEFKGTGFGALADILVSSDAMKGIEPLFESFEKWPEKSILVWNFDEIVDEYQGDEEMDFEDDAPEVPSKYVPMPLRIYRHYGSDHLDRGRSYEQPNNGGTPRGLWGIELDKLPLLKEKREKDPDALTEEVGEIVDELCRTIDPGAGKVFFDFRLKEDAKILRLSGALQIAPFVNESTAVDCFKQAFACYDGMIMEPGTVTRSSFPAFREWPEGSIVVWNLDAVVPVDEGSAAPVEASGEQAPGFVGKVGESVIIKAAAIYRATTWRSGRLYLIEDTDGNIYTVKTRRRLPGNVEPGTVTLRARVKNHVEYRGVKQTWVERARVI